MGQLIAGKHVRTVVSEMQASGEVFKGILLDAPLSVSGATPNTTATGNVYIQEVEGVNSTNGLPQFSFQSGFTNTNATKKAALFRTGNQTSNVIEVKFDDYNFPASEPIIVTMQPGQHYLFISMRPNGGAHQASWRIKDSGASFVNAGSAKAANSNVFNWDGTVTVESAFVESIQAQVGESVDVSLSKEKLKLISKVSSSATFSQESNWKMVGLIYKHQNSSKRLVASIKDLSSVKKMKLKNALSGEKYDLHKIIISTSARELLVLKPEDFPSGNSITLK
jgi:hypothetical protein